MSGKKTKTANYIVPLGTFRGEFDQDAVDPAWKLIHELRVQHGLSIIEMAEIANGTGTSVSKGERGGPVSIAFTRRILQAFGYDLKIVPKEEISNG